MKENERGACTQKKKCEIQTSILAHMKFFFLKQKIKRTWKERLINVGTCEWCIYVEMVKICDRMQKIQKKELSR